MKAEAYFRTQLAAQLPRRLQDVLQALVESQIPELDAMVLFISALERHIAETGADGAALMDWLQGRGIISDISVMPRDVHSGDAEEAVRQIKAAQEIAGAP